MGEYLGGIQIYTSFYYFGCAILGALVGAYYKFPLFFLAIPLLFFKKPRIGLAFLIFFIVNLGFVGNVTVKTEFVGVVKSVQNNSSILKLSYFDGVNWKKLGFDVLLYNEEKLDTIVYFKGELRRRNSYPFYYAKPTYLATATNYNSFKHRIYNHFEAFRRYVSKINPFYESLFGSAARDEDFIQSGLYHIFCVSGMHVSLLYLFALSIVKLVTHRKFLRIILSLLFPTIFVIGSGMNLPAFRALLMLVLSSIFQLADYKINPINTVSIIGTAMIIANPEIVYSLSFYMTFFATIGVLVCDNKILTNVGGFLGSAPYVSLINPVNPFSIVGTIIVSIPVQIIMFGLTISYLLFSSKMYYLSSFVLYALSPFAWFVKLVAQTLSKFPTIPRHPSITIAFALTYVIFIAIVIENKRGTNLNMVPRNI
ncbi:competence protein ComEC [Fervidobacterium gondwanense DSM 13020]|uniref:Competence protein ComEC n=1 Tax=Fervidobacterium gondwanense DSM 13020 TaxID=1121883 RepID=A0A1M7T5V1_FERGO|nr:competence protein ComEC [Fervidobacterium gondwanense DSM 13020]